MVPPEFSVADFNVPDQLAKSTAEHHRNSKPLQPGWGLDAITLLPGLFLELHVVQQHKHIHLIDQVKVT